MPEVTDPSRRHSTSMDVEAESIPREKIGTRVTEVDTPRSMLDASCQNDLETLGIGAVSRVHSVRVALPSLTVSNDHEICLTPKVLGHNPVLAIPKQEVSSGCCQVVFIYGARGDSGRRDGGAPAVPSVSYIMSSEVLAHIDSVELGSFSDHGGLLRALEIADNKAAGVPVLDSDDTGVAGVSGRFTSALTDLADPVQQTDVLESMLFAQLAASAKYNAFDDPPKCICVRKSRLKGLTTTEPVDSDQLKQVAWASIELKFSEASISGSKVAVKDMVLAFLSSAGVEQAAKDLIYSLSLPGPLVPILYSTTAKGRTSTFSLAGVKQAGQNLCHAHSSYTAAAYDVLDVLFFTLDRSSSKFFQMSTPTYANGIRDAVKARIKDHAINYIAKAPLADAP
ncbi:hypothetical protein RHS01_09201 [Rhizoctonia solani]|uniref:Uncharacterized protein n=1 Tax=Rhizoctonia solani TaxID=456999 RepID=A0A8H7I3X5_9AGAM|nr:hypothetical protein RHS01_09201 [Rhizoctonia solani]